MIIKYCLLCNKKTIDKGSNKKKKYCSKRCASKYYNLHRDKLPKFITKNCELCGKETTDSTDNKNKKYCSKRCRSKYYNLHKDKLPKTITKHCELCDKTFVDICDHKKQRFCSKKCRVKVYTRTPKCIKTRQLWVSNNREKRRKRGRELSRTTKYKLIKRTYYNRPEIKKRYNFLAAKRRAMKLRATPTWANLDDINKIYMSCPKGFHVDHFIPLQHKSVCGLHIPVNLRIVPASYNLRKSNKLLDLPSKS